MSKIAVFIIQFGHLLVSNILVHWNTHNWNNGKLMLLSQNAKCCNVTATFFNFSFAVVFLIF